MKTISALLLLMMFNTSAMAQSNHSALSDASALVADGSAVVVSGSIMALAGSGTVVVRSIEAAGEGSRIVLVGASEAAAVSLELSGALARGASLAVGAAVSVAAISTGVLLISAGKVIAFIPNEVGKALLHHSAVRPVGTSR